MLKTAAVKLYKEELWREVYPNMEMMAKKNPLCPELSFVFSGLKEDKEYRVFITIERFDNIRYGINREGKWARSETRKKNATHAYKSVFHPKGAQNGNFWTEKPVTFKDVKISYKLHEVAKDENIIYVQTMFKYAPVITITDADYENEQRFVLEVAQFFPVSNYWQHSISEWKCKNNKWTTYKHGGQGSKRKRTSEDSDEPVPKKKSSKKSGSEESNPIDEQKTVLIENPMTNNAQQEYRFDQNLPYNGNLLQQYQQYNLHVNFNVYYHGFHQWTNYNNYSMMNHHFQPELFDPHFQTHNNFPPQYPLNYAFPHFNVPQEITNENAIPIFPNNYQLPNYQNN